MVEGSFLRLSLSNTCNDHGYDLRLPTTCTWLRIYCSRIYWVFLLSHLASKRFVTSVGFYLFFRFPNGIYHHGTATEMGGRTASTGYDTAQEARAEHSSAHITLLAAHM